MREEILKRPSGAYVLDNGFKQVDEPVSISVPADHTVYPTAGQTVAGTIFGVREFEPSCWCDYQDSKGKWYSVLVYREWTTPTARPVVERKAFKRPG